MAWPHTPEVNYKDLRATVHAFLRKLRDHDTVSSDDFYDWVIRLAQIDFDIQRSVLLESLDDSDPLIGAAAAFYLLYVRKQHPTCIQPSHAERAFHKLAQELQNETDDVDLWVFTILGAIGDLTQEIIQVLKGTLQSKSEVMRFRAAAALCGAGEAGEAGAIALQLLHRTMLGNDPSKAVHAASALGRAGISEAVAVEKLIENLHKLSGNGRLSAVISLGQLGSKSAKAIPILTGLLNDAKESRSFRLYVARSLGKIDTKAETLELALVQAVKAKDAAAIQRALDGLIVGGWVSFQLIQTLADLLENQDEDIRGVSAVALSQFGPMVTDVIPALIDRVRKETNKDICWFVVKALVSAGEAAVPDLVALLKEADFRTMPIVVSTLENIGRAAVESVTHTLITDSDERVREVAARILYGMGPKASGAVPMLIDLLKTDDDAIRLDAIIALANIGQGAGAAVPSLIEQLLGPNDEIAKWAERALLFIGLEAIPHLQQMLQNADAIGQERIDRILRQLGAAVKPAASMDFAFFNQDEALELFAAVGQILRDRGAASWRDIAKEFKKNASRGILGNRLPTNEQTIRVKLCKLETIVSKKKGEGIKFKESNSTRRSGLSEYATQLLPRVIQYLESVAAEPKANNETEA